MYFFMNLVKNLYINFFNGLLSVVDNELTIYKYSMLNSYRIFKNLGQTTLPSAQS